MANLDYSRVEVDLLDALKSCAYFDEVRYDVVSGNGMVSIASKGELRGELANFLGEKEGRVILKYEKDFSAILSITIHYEDKGDATQKLRNLLCHVDDIEDYDVAYPYDEDELIEDGLYFTFLDKDVDDLDKLYDKTNAIVRAAHKFILAIG
ncbi:MAG: hypothetical protein J6A47_05090 [Bacilli bacterium]|nr:hypothetical protein [Bacilli bacterium]MBO6285856.1 hypothetical protein [Bacilli bacterium]